MKKVTTLVLMLGFILSGALCYANGAARTENEKGKGQILTIHKAQHGGIDKSSSIVATLNGHVLSVVNANDWGNCIGGVKSTITIGSPSGIIVPSNSNKCFRASESITITSEGEFTLPLGAQMTLMTHDCVDY